MKGSEKQIKWAKDIVANWEKQIDLIISEARERVEVRNDMPPIWLDIVKKIGETYKSRLGLINDAAMVIRDRNMNIGRRVFDVMAAEYDKPENKVIREKWLAERQ